MSRLPIPSRRHCQRGLSYLEVLIAAAIGLVGTLGAVALFPVAFLQLQRGLEADNANAIGESAVNSAQAIGLANPRKWMFNSPVVTPNTTGWQQVQNDSIPANYASPADSVIPTFQSYGNRSWHRAIQPLSSFCIDPRFISEINTANNQEYWQFPYVPQRRSGMAPDSNDVRMWRISLANPVNNALTLSPEQARLWFRSSDDLIFNRDIKDANGPLPALQSYMTFPDPNGGTVPKTGRRDYMAEYEWIATLVPKFNGTGANLVNSGEYVLSLVVFHNRRPRLDTILVNTQASDNFAEDERIADVIAFNGSGVGGGDITVRTREHTDITRHVEADLTVRENDWVLMSGMAYMGPLATAQRVAPIHQWYRVAGVQNESTPSNVMSGAFEKQMTLQGADWPVDPSKSLYVPIPNHAEPPQYTNAELFTQITFVSGVVGVFERTIRLD